MELFAQQVMHHGAGWSLGDLLVAVVIVVAVLSVAYVALTHFKVPVPPAVVTIFWICVLAFVAVVAIRFLLSL